MNNEQVKLS